MAGSRNTRVIKRVGRIAALGLASTALLVFTAVSVYQTYTVVIQSLLNGGGVGGSLPFLVVALISFGTMIAYGVILCRKLWRSMRRLFR